MTILPRWTKKQKKKWNEKNSKTIYQTKRIRFTRSSAKIPRDHNYNYTVCITRNIENNNNTTTTRRDGSVQKYYIYFSKKNFLL